MPLSTIVEHDFFKSLAAAASVKVQEVALLSTAVGTGVVLRSTAKVGSWESGCLCSQRKRSQAEATRTVFHIREEIQGAHGG